MMIALVSLSMKSVFSRARIETEGSTTSASASRYQTSARRGERSRSSAFTPISFCRE